MDGADSHLWGVALNSDDKCFGVAEPNGCGGAMRESDTPYGTQRKVGEEPLCGLGCVRLG
jgi:hypothetical protein